MRSGIAWPSRAGRRPRSGAGSGAAIRRRLVRRGDVPDASDDMTDLAPCLMVQGTGSGVGKSVLTAALCRLFARAGYRVAPFKSQNMSLNAAVTTDGGETGRAQAAQAEASGAEPRAGKNTVALLPDADDRSQVVVRGRAMASLRWREYSALAPV